MEEENIKWKGKKW